MIWIALGTAAAVAAAIVFWWIRKRRRYRLISFVALLKEPVTFDAAVIASVAGKAWNADLGSGEAEGADGFVGDAGPSIMIFHDGHMFMLNSFSTPYIDDVEETAAKMTDLRLRALFAEHKAWFSCDAMGVDGRTPEADVREWYRRLGILFAELLDEICLLIYLPDCQLAYPINEDTLAALRSDDPVQALHDTMTLPIIEVADDDPLMKQAVAKARQEWPRFVSAYEERAGKNFSVKAPVTHAGNTEFIWIAVTAIEGELIYGELGNDPGNLGSLKLGSKVSAPVAELNDWIYLDAREQMVGGFTIEAVKSASRRARKA
jgi:uncharacterized protein YegJ (DUF2314 family)